MLGMNFNDITLMNLSNPVEDRDFFITVSTMLVAGPFTYVVIPILGLELSQPKKRWWVILLTLLIIALFMLQSGRRSILIYIIPAVLYIVMKNPKNSLSKRAKRKLVLIFSSLTAIIIYLISWLSFQRDTSFKETGYVYLGGGIAGFSERIQLIDTWYWGAATLHGLLVPIMIGVKYLTHSYPIWWVKLDALVEAANEIQIGPSEYMNAFTTMFYVPYIDFGGVGVLLISLLVGIIYGKAYKRAVFDPNSVNRSVYALLIVGLFGSMYTLYFTQSPYVLSFFYIYILFKKE
jgi:oligosaccharide repeat unit polymerase